MKLTKSHPLGLPILVNIKSELEEEFDVFIGKGHASVTHYSFFKKEEEDSNG